MNRIRLYNIIYDVDYISCFAEYNGEISIVSVEINTKKVFFTFFTNNKTIISYIAKTLLMITPKSGEKKRLNDITITF